MITTPSLAYITTTTGEVGDTRETRRGSKVEAKRRIKSGGRCTQIDYLLVRRGDLKECKDCRVFPGEACSSQHRLLALDTLFKRVQRRRVGSAVLRILWKNLNGDVMEAFKLRAS
ncbi:hypothetical protein Tco_1524306 [Tanacetum coccineum]